MSNSIFSLSGKHVLITGGAGLLGVKHAEAILQAGGTPILIDVDAHSLTNAVDRLSTGFGATVLSAVIDVTKEEEVADFSRKLLSNGLAVDVLINNAARNPKVSHANMMENSSRLENLDLGSYMKDVEIGLHSSVICAKVFGTAMASRKSGVIINVASDLGVIAPDQRLYRKEGVPEAQQDVKPVSYSVIKHALIGLTKYLATYWASDGVRCNALSPGGVLAGQNELFLQRISHLIPMGRMADINELQGAIIFLCSPASSYMNGANLIIDGGRSVW